MCVFYLFTSHRSTDFFLKILNLRWTGFFSPSLYCLSTFITFPPRHVLFSPLQVHESTGAPFAMTYGEQGRDCERVACLELWLSVLPLCLWHHRDRGTKGMEEERYREEVQRQWKGVGAEGNGVESIVEFQRSDQSPRGAGQSLSSVSWQPGLFRWGQGWGEQRNTDSRERERKIRGKEYILLRVICPLTSTGAGQVMKHKPANSYNYCHHCFLAWLPLSLLTMEILFWVHTPIFQHTHTQIYRYTTNHNQCNDTFNQN